MQEHVAPAADIERLRLELELIDNELVQIMIDEADRQPVLVAVGVSPAGQRHDGGAVVRRTDSIRAETAQQADTVGDAEPFGLRLQVGTQRPVADDFAHDVTALGAELCGRGDQRVEAFLLDHAADSEDPCPAVPTGRRTRRCRGRAR